MELHWRLPLIPASVVAVAALSLLAAGCGGGGSSGVARVASTTASTTARQNGTTTQNGSLASAFAFARCMRSHGVPGWPDPTSTGGFDKSKLRQLGLSVSRARALEQGPCNIPLPSSRPTIPRADESAYVKGAACMRAHGVPDFPDPTFPNNHVQFNIPSSINQDSARFKSVATICTKLIPAGLPYSSRSAP
jgi:hypothetical protein